MHLIIGKYEERDRNAHPVNGALSDEARPLGLPTRMNEQKGRVTQCSKPLQRQERYAQYNPCISTNNG